jgi:hypothetical protein
VARCIEPSPLPTFTTTGALLVASSARNACVVRTTPRTLVLLLAGQSVPGRGVMSAHLTPGVQRLLDRLTGTPVAVYDAAWSLITANPMWFAVPGGEAAQRLALLAVLGTQSLMGGGSGPDGDGVTA